MERRNGCRDDDLLSIAGELASRWERSQRVWDRAAAEGTTEGQNRDCLPCLLEDWKSGFDD
jgi:hypothetical protein